MVRQQSCPQPLAESSYCSLLPPSTGNSLLPCSPRSPGKAEWGTYGNKRAGLSSYGPPGKRSGWSRAAAAGPGGGAWCGGDGKHNSSWGWWWWSTPAKTLQRGRASVSHCMRAASKPRKPQEANGKDHLKAWIWTCTALKAEIRVGPGGFNTDLSACVGHCYSNSLARTG